MKEVLGDLWDYLGQAVIAVTTNGHVTKEGRAVFGRGSAGQAGVRFPSLAARLGALLQQGGNHVYDLGEGLVNFPVEETPWSQPDLPLISRSAKELRALADTRGWRRIVVPRPGCGGGGLDWKLVRPLLVKHFDERFLVVDQNKGRR